jgi:hypothetical protein
MSQYVVITSKTEGGVMAIAEGNNCTILKPIRTFDDFESLDDNSLGNIGHVFVNQSGFMALARRND